MGILPNHTALLTTLDFGEVVVRTGDQEEFFAIGGGFVEVQPDHVLLPDDRIAAHVLPPGQLVAQGRDGYPAEKLGELVHTALTTAKPDVRYAAEKGRMLEKVVRKVASPRVLDRLIGKTLGLLPARRS